MATIGYSPAPFRMAKILPTREDLRTMWANPRVQVTAILCALVFGLAVLGGMIILAVNGLATEIFASVALAMIGQAVGRAQGARAERNRQAETDA